MLLAGEEPPDICSDELGISLIKLMNTELTNYAAIIGNHINIHIISFQTNFVKLCRSRPEAQLRKSGRFCQSGGKVD